MNIFKKHLNTKTINTLDHSKIYLYIIQSSYGVKICKKVTFTHPYYDIEALSCQSKLYKIQNKNNILFCGSYFGYGFHEDGIKSSIGMLKMLND